MQLTLPTGRDAPAPRRPRAPTPRDYFEAFHAANPRVWELFERFALAAARSGRQRFGARMVWERMRWYVAIEMNQPASDYKLNDHLTPFYARMFLARHPEHAGLFETRGRDA